MDPTEIANLAALSPREMETMVRLAVGKTCRQIAVELGLGSKTADTHRQHALAKLGLDGNVALARFALRHGLVTLDDDQPTEAFYTALEAARRSIVPRQTESRRRSQQLLREAAP